MTYRVLINGFGHIGKLAKENDVTLDAGFYYMANAMGRLLGCIISGFSYQMARLIGCFVFAGIFLFICSVFSFYFSRFIQISR